jgi:D-serine deaminase-like pyridoxal phosphate-dependent protein
MAKEGEDQRARRRRRRARLHIGAAAGAAGVSSEAWSSRSMSARTAVASRPALRRSPSGDDRAGDFVSASGVAGAAQHLLRRAAARGDPESAKQNFRARQRAAIAAFAAQRATVTGSGDWPLKAARTRISQVLHGDQAGSYLIHGRRLPAAPLFPAPDQHPFEQSLFVVATVMSTPARERAIVDAGMKAERIRLRTASISRRAPT